MCWGLAVCDLVGSRKLLLATWKMSPTCLVASNCIAYICNQSLLNVSCLTNNSAERRSLNPVNLRISWWLLAPTPLLSSSSHLMQQPPTLCQVAVTTCILSWFTETVSYPSILDTTGRDRTWISPSSQHHLLRFVFCHIGFSVAFWFPFEEENKLRTQAVTLN